ncbi:hypothetical protein GCM10009630_35160 [Kribbella jejuensis]|uniref:Uncharacterized protein n=1 Tax=Kribbella jejuensis TaxID=236068 RepID=A0A542DAP7_9ACTN|nr:hypothetical protein [Kribbella jejuensis]TQJ00146.1 hypothetical protein FB475_7139 [Kribbella jejuensis]
MVRIPGFWRSRRGAAATTSAATSGAGSKRDARGVEAISPELALGAGFLIETAADGLHLHAPRVDLRAERLVALVVEPGERGPMLAYRVFDPDRQAADKAYDMHWSEGSSGGLWEESVKSKLLAAESPRLPIGSRLADAGFEQVSDGIWRHSRFGSTITAVVRDGEVGFYTPTGNAAIDDVIRRSRVVGPVQVQTYRGPQPALRLSGEWMTYTLEQPFTHPLDVEMTRPATRAELGLPEVTLPDAPAAGDETERILGLTEIDGRPVRELEAWMRPFDPDRPSEPVDFNRSQEGFLGPRDSLLRTLARDNEVVRRLGLTHEELAVTVENATTASARFAVKQYVGPDHHRYRIEANGSMGVQPSPFRDGGVGSSDYRVVNERTGSALELSDLTASMARRGFYQGPGTSYRSAPEDIVRTFTQLSEKAGGEQKIAQVVAEVDAYFSTLDAVDRSSAAGELRPSAPAVADPDRPGGRSANGRTSRAPDVPGR